ncbi:MAG: alpha/beta hydrolase, partial [Acidimicrobiia bacterium]|nr:alpha/beta hydrolase [Acidimicrobiia bacterium]
RSVREADRPVLAVPTTSIYTRTDGIVHWRTCLVRPGPISENVEVHGSHCGLGFNPAVAFVIADRLAQRADRWRPFRPPLWMRGAFPFPARVQSQSSPEAA